MKVDRKRAFVLAALIVLRQLFSANDNQVSQVDIVMLLTPRLVRTHELTLRDISPIYIGTQQNLGLGDPPPLIAPGEAAAAQPAAAADTPPAGTTAVAPPAPARGNVTVPIIPPGSTQVPGTIAAPPGTGVAPVTPPTTVQPPAAGPTQILLTAPGTEFRVGGGPYTVPISVSNASRLSTVSVTITFNPLVLRVRNVQEGSFMHQGDANAQFTQQVDPASGRIDIAIARPADGTWASGGGLLAVVLFDAVMPGSVNVAVTGSASAPDGAAVPLQFASINVSAR